MEHKGLSNTQELERLYYALGDFIYKELQKYQKDKTKTIGIVVIEAIRHYTLEYLKTAVDSIGKKIAEETLDDDDDESY